MYKHGIVIMIIVLATFSMLYTIFEYDSNAFSLNGTASSIIKNDSWISERNDLNVTIQLVPKIPVIDETTKNII